MLEEVVELVSTKNVAAGVNHGATRKIFVVLRVFPAVQLVHYHLPDSMRPETNNSQISEILCIRLEVEFLDRSLPGWTVLEVTVATVGHSEVHGIGPKWRVVKSSGDGRIVKEGLFFHHGKLVVSSHSKVGCSHSNNSVVSQISIFLSNNPHASHLLSPVINSSFGPESFIVVMPKQNQT